MTFLGRKNELKAIRERLEDHSKSQLIILYGRRRVGKSRLISEALLKERNILKFEGIEGESTDVQIDQFLNDLSRQTNKVKFAARNWREAFQGLEESIKEGRHVIIVDELPWLAVGKSTLISELKLFWDKWSLINPRLVLFLCGSVAQFMVKHVVHSKALHNRKTLEMALMPLTPIESSQFVNKKGLKDKAILYMCFGGIPKYLEQINPKLSMEKNINQLAFTKVGFFVNEFETIFKEQFRLTKNYELIVYYLSQGPLNISELALKLKIPKGGGVKVYLDNLEKACFVKSYNAFSFGEKTGLRTKRYKLSDPFLIFYFYFVRPNLKIINANDTHDLFPSITEKKWPIFLGLQFEKFCEDSLLVILKKLHYSLPDVTNWGPYFRQKSNNGPGVQFDMVVELRNGSYILMEFKFKVSKIDTDVAKEMQAKIDKMNFSQNITLTKVLVAMNGATRSLEKLDYFDVILTLEDLL